MKKKINKIKFPLFNGSKVTHKITLVSKIKSTVALKALAQASYLKINYEILMCVYSWFSNLEYLNILYGSLELAIRVQHHAVHNYTKNLPPWKKRICDPCQCLSWGWKPGTQI